MLYGYYPFNDKFRCLHVTKNILFQCGCHTLFRHFHSSIKKIVLLSVGNSIIVVDTAENQERIALEGIFAYVCNRAVKAEID